MSLANIKAPHVRLSSGLFYSAETKFPGSSLQYLHSLCLFPKRTKASFEHLTTARLSPKKSTGFSFKSKSKRVLLGGCHFFLIHMAFQPAQAAAIVPADLTPRQTHDQDFFAGAFTDEATGQKFDLYDHSTTSSGLTQYYFNANADSGTNNSSTGEANKRDWLECQGLSTVHRACCRMAHGFGNLFKDLSITTLRSFINDEVGAAFPNSRGNHIPGRSAIRTIVTTCAPLGRTTTRTSSTTAKAPILRTLPPAMRSTGIAPSSRVPTPTGVLSIYALATARRVATAALGQRWGRTRGGEPKMKPYGR